MNTTKNSVNPDCLAQCSCELSRPIGEFDEWFKDSAVVDSHGNPSVMYHGTTEGFEDFQENSRGLHFFSPSPEWVSQYLKGESGVIPEGASIKPVYISAKKPFDFENKKHVNLVASHASLGSLAISQIKKGEWQRLEDRTLISNIKKLGFDGLYVKENGVKNLAVFSVDQIKSAFIDRDVDASVKLRLVNDAEGVPDSSVNLLAVGEAIVPPGGVPVPSVQGGRVRAAEAMKFLETELAKDLIAISHRP
jgi:hypothetical protein